MIVVIVLKNTKNQWTITSCFNLESYLHHHADLFTVLSYSPTEIILNHFYNFTNSKDYFESVLKEWIMIKNKHNISELVNKQNTLVFKPNMFSLEENHSMWFTSE